MYSLQSKFDDKSFHADKNIIEASVLLKNLCELTEITQPIILECSSQCLEIYIKLINHYDVVTPDIHDNEFEKELFKDFSDEKIANLVKEIGYLDSDYFIDTIADLILDRIKKMNCTEMQEYFGVEDDFTAEERNVIQQNRLEYLLSLNTAQFQFPYSYGTNFLMMKNKLASPMNVILARIIKRSNEKTAFKLSMINKTFKNENDRHPIKVTKFFEGDKWLINVDYNISYRLTTDKYDQSYFDAIKKRKIVPYSDISVFYYGNDTLVKKDGKPPCTSLNFVIPEKVFILHVYFTEHENQIYRFDIRQCPFSSIIYHFSSISIKFNEFYQQLIAKDLSKEIKIQASVAFNFFPGEMFHIYKKAQASKFHEIYVISLSDKKITLEFKNFLLNYMEDDGIIRSQYKLFKVADAYSKSKMQFIYYVYDIKKIL